MATIAELVTPQAAAPVAAAPPAEGAPAPGTLQEPLTPTDDALAQIPDAVLQLPTFRAILEGQPPALSIKVTEQDPDLAVIKSNVEPLLYSGFGFYQGKDGQTQVLYNSQFIDGNALKLADDKGQLDKVAAPYSELKAFFGENLGEAAVEPVAPAAAAAPASQAMGAPAPASTQTQLANARIKNLAVGSATSGPVPGGGRVLNNILKPTV